jgi:hypothetical protein
MFRIHIETGSEAVFLLSVEQAQSQTDGSSTQTHPPTHIMAAGRSPLGHITHDITVKKQIN